MELKPPFRPATANDARAIADLVAIASGGVAVIGWAEEAAREAGISPMDVGARTYARPHGQYSYRNTVVAESNGAILGALLTFAMHRRQGEPAQPPPFDGTDVFAPYNYLEAPDSWYICAMAVFPGYRGQGIGTGFLGIARRQAVEHAFDRLSLVGFEQNEGAVRLYKRHGFEIVDRAPVVPHPMIRCGGDALLMVAPAR